MCFFLAGAAAAGAASTAAASTFTTIASIASTALTVASTISQAQQQKKYHDYQTAQALADSQAEREQAEVNADRVRKAGRYQQGEARASLAASGVEVAAGTPVKIVSEIFRNNELDAQQEIIGGRRRAGNLESEANLNRIAGKNAQQSGYLRAGGSLLEGAYDLNKNWRKAA